MRGRRANEQIRHEEDLRRAKADLEEARSTAAAELREAADEAERGSLDTALRQATIALGDLEKARQEYEHYRSLVPID